jgi:hypothetical protein
VISGSQISTGSSEAPVNPAGATPMIRKSPCELCRGQRLVADDDHGVPVEGGLDLREGRGVQGHGDVGAGDFGADCAATRADFHLGAGFNLGHRILPDRTIP